MSNFLKKAFTKTFSCVNIKTEIIIILVLVVSLMKRQNYSRKREAIYQALCSTKIHPTADWIYQQLKPIYPDLSLGTVYRNISHFKEEGLIISVGVVKGQERLDANISPHAHFICSACGNVIDVEEINPNQSIDELVSHKYHFDVQYHDLVFHGLCKDCK